MIKNLVDQIKTKKTKVVDVVANSLASAKKSQKDLNAFITICEKEAMARAESLDNALARGEKPGKLFGVPIAIKDALLTKGIETTAASKILEGYIPPYSATVVERLEAEGAVIIGKANMDEFAMGASNENSAYGPVKNPWALDRVPGGSSGGSAAAVAAGITPVSIGTDTGGSIREPAHFCGIVGIKPTYGRVSRYGVVAFASSLDQVGPMGRTVKDAALTLEVISGKDQKDSTSASRPVEAWSELKLDNLKELRIGLPAEYFVEGLDPDVKKSIDNAIQILKAAGASTQTISLPHTKEGVAVYYIIAPCEASANLSRYDGVRFGYRNTEVNDLEELYRKSRGIGFGAEPKRRIMLGTFALSSGYYDAYYKKACQVRRLIKDDFTQAFQKCDVILAPVTTGTAFKIGAKSQDPLEMYLNDVFTLPPSLAGIPGLSLNCGYSKDGLPIGVQLLAPHFEEGRIIGVADYLERQIQDQRKVPYGL